MFTQQLSWHGNLKIIFLMVFTLFTVDFDSVADELKLILNY